jgi:arabinofuranosyltransferase
VVARLGSVGRVGWAAGPRVHLVDRNGLADPLAARLRLPRERRGRPGHEKSLPAPWVLARFAVPTTGAGGRMLAASESVRAARGALACPPLRELLAATTAPLDAERFLANVGYAVRERSLRFAADPIAAQAELCGGEGGPA